MLIRSLFIFLFFLLGSCAKKHVFPLFEPITPVNSILQDKNVYIFVSSNIEIINFEENFQSLYPDKRAFAKLITNHLLYGLSPRLTFVKDSIVTRYLQDLEAWSQKNFDDNLEFFAKKNKLDIIIKVVDISVDDKVFENYGGDKVNGTYMSYRDSTETCDLNCKVSINDLNNGQLLAEFIVRSSESISYGSSGIDLFKTSAKAGMALSKATESLTDRITAYIRQGKMHF